LVRLRRSNWRTANGERRDGVCDFVAMRADVLSAAIHDIKENSARRVDRGLVLAITAKIRRVEDPRVEAERVYCLLRFRIARPPRARRVMVAGSGTTVKVAAAVVIGAWVPRTCWFPLAQ